MLHFEVLHRWLVPPAKLKKLKKIECLEKVSGDTDFDKG